MSRNIMPPVQFFRDCSDLAETQFGLLCLTHHSGQQNWIMMMMMMMMVMMIMMMVMMMMVLMMMIMIVTWRYDADMMIT